MSLPINNNFEFDISILVKALEYIVTNVFDRQCAGHFSLHRRLRQCDDFFRRRLQSLRHCKVQKKGHLKDLGLALWRRYGQPATPLLLRCW